MERRKVESEDIRASRGEKESEKSRIAVGRLNSIASLSRDGDAPRSWDDVSYQIRLSITYPISGVLALGRRSWPNPGICVRPKAPPTSLLYTTTNPHALVTADIEAVENARKGNVHTGTWVYLSDSSKCIELHRP